jgi:hypothetical protein
MADSPLKKFQSSLRALLERAARAARNTARSRAFFDDAQFGSWEDVYKLFDRKDLLVRLKGLLGREHNAADWAAPKSQMEYLAGWERDVTALRRTRLDRYRAASQEKIFIGANIEQFAAELGRIQSQQTSKTSS